jgi:hypothetical protein
MDQERFDAAAQAAIRRCLGALGMRSDTVAVSVGTTLEGA